MDMLRRGLRLLAEQRAFRWLMTTQFAGHAADGLVQAAVAKSVVFGGQQGFDVEGARSPDELLRIVLYVFVPYAIVSPFFGVVIDTWDRRRLLVATNGIRAVAVSAVALAGTGAVPDAALFGMFVLTLAGTRVVLATKSAALPDTLPEPSLVHGNAVSQLGGAMFQVGAAGVAVLASRFVAADPIVLAGGGVYLAAAFAAVRVERETHDRSVGIARATKRVFASIGAGVAEVSRRPPAAASIATYFWLRLMWSFCIVAVGFVARELLVHDDVQVLIVTGGAGAAGAGMGFALANYLHERVRSTAHLVVAASAAAGVAVVVLGPFVNQPSLAGLTFWLGFGFFLGKISLDTLVQEALGRDFRGRAFSLYDIAYNAAWLVAAVALNIVWSDRAQGAAIAGMGVVFLLGLAAIAFWFARAGLMQPRVRAEAL